MIVTCSALSRERSRSRFSAGRICGPHFTSMKIRLPAGTTPSTSASVGIRSPRNFSPRQMPTSTVAQLGQRRLPDRQFAIAGPAGVGIVQADDLAVGGQIEIPLDAVGPLLPGQAEGGQGVFRGVVRSSAMGDHLLGKTIEPSSTGRAKPAEEEDQRAKGDSWLAGYLPTRR